MKVLFLDESGDHDLVNIDPQYPIFVLAGCIMDSEYEEKVLVPALKQFKKDLFGNSDIILHLADYTRNKACFGNLCNKDFREKFYVSLNKILKDTDLTLLACVVDKREHIKHYKNAMDPYLLSLEVVLERYIMFLKRNKEKGVVIAESRSHQLDNQLNLAFLDIKISGTRFLRPRDIVDTIVDFRIKKKDENIAGLQLIDTIISPIGRRFLGRKNFYIAYDVIKNKFRKHDCGKYKGYGLVVLPKK